MANRSINKAIVLGNLTRDPELKYTPNGAAVCTFGVATNRSWKTNEGQTKEDVQYHRIVAWNKVAELCGKLLSKGKKVYVEGRLVYRSFVGKDGQQRSITEIVLEDFIVLSSGRSTTSQEEPVEEPKQEAKTEEVKKDKKDDKKEEEEEEDSTESTNEEESIDPDDIPF
ncbi:MAG: single-stranded DNA-binding protein [Patescibacteria group bacterium]|nr:single-stranded DNA-binding protein [Patescibacteria group bacterium]